jgi:hypothetical protein
MTKHEHTRLQPLTRYRAVIASKDFFAPSDIDSKKCIRKTRELKKQAFLWIDQHSRAANLELAHRITNLPQELRDMIYTYTWLGITPRRRTYFAVESVALLHSTCPGPPCRCMKKLPHFVDLSFMGAQVAREMLLQFKSHECVPKLILAGSEIKAHVQNDMYHVGVTMERVFKNIDLVLEIGDCHFDEARHIISRRVAWGQSQDQVQEAADALIQLAFGTGKAAPEPTLHGRTRTITLDIYIFYMGLESLELLLSIFGPCFVALHRQGFRTSVDFGVDMQMRYWLGDEAWTWSIERWNEQLRKGDRLGYTRTSVVRPTRPATEKVIEWQMPRWELIMRHLYRVDMTGN